MDMLTKKTVVFRDLFQKDTQQMGLEIFLRRTHNKSTNKINKQWFHSDKRFLEWGIPISTLNNWIYRGSTLQPIKSRHELRNQNCDFTRLMTVTSSADFLLCGLHHETYAGFHIRNVRWNPCENRWTKTHWTRMKTYHHRKTPHSGL